MAPCRGPGWESWVEWLEAPAGPHGFTDRGCMTVGSTFDGGIVHSGDSDGLRGNAGCDRLFGGKGRDWVGGEGHDDLLRGGSGADTLVFARKGGRPDPGFPRRPRPA